MVIVWHINIMCLGSSNDINKKRNEFEQWQSETQATVEHTPNGYITIGIFFNTSPSISFVILPFACGAIRATW